MCFGDSAIVSVMADLGSEPFDGLYFAGRGILRHENDAGGVEFAKAEGRCGAMIAGGGGNDSPIPLGLRQREHFIHRTSYLKRSGVLQIFKFEIYIGPG